MNPNEPQFQPLQEKSPEFGSEKQLGFSRQEVNEYSLANRSPSADPRSSLFQSPRVRQTKKRILGAMLGVFLVYRLFFAGELKNASDETCIRDETHGWTESLNERINEGGDFYYWFMIIGQILIDFNIFLFNILQIFKIQNFFITAWTTLFYGIRGILMVVVTYIQQVDKFPYPPGIYWEAPGFPPSLGVPYGVTRDFFYSGHTGMMVFCCLFWGLKQSTKPFRIIALVGLPYIILVVISTRVHYLIDVYAGAIFAVYCFKYSMIHCSKFDRFVSAFVIVGQFLIERLKELFQRAQTQTQKSKKFSDAYIKV